MGKSGWWKQLTSNEYPETQTDFGQDMRALNGERNQGASVQNPEKILLQEPCPECGKLYWADKKRCFYCGWHLSEKPKESSAQHMRRQVYCPLCGGKMKLRIAKKGKNFGKKFWGCSRYPACKAISSYSG